MAQRGRGGLTMPNLTTPDDDSKARVLPHVTADRMAEVAK